jgi:Protein of unknown function (DUF2892)
VGNSDRLIRLIVGVALIASAFFLGGAWRWIAAPGAMLVLTAAVRICPAYWLLRIRTIGAPPARR